MFSSQEEYSHRCGRLIVRSVPSYVYVHRRSHLYNKHKTCEEQITAVILAAFFIFLTPCGLVFGSERSGRTHCLSLKVEVKLFFQLKSVSSGRVVPTC